MNQQGIASSNSVVHLDDDDFESLVIQSEKPVLIDFWANWCRPCHMIAPTLDALAGEYAGRIRVAKVDVDANPMATHKYGVRSIPALLLFRDGQVMEQLVGVRPKEEIARIIDNNL